MPSKCCEGKVQCAVGEVTRCVCGGGDIANEAVSFTELQQWGVRSLLSRVRVSAYVCTCVCTCLCACMVMSRDAGGVGAEEVREASESRSIRGRGS